MAFADVREHRLNPFPDGWFVIEASDRLKKEQLISKTWMGKEIIAWRDGDGKVCVAEAYCPHLGAHLGPEAGGQLRDGCLVCPFHGFEYDISGKCVKATAGPPPPKARLKRIDIEEVNGFVFGYHDNRGRKPSWRIPDVSQDGWDGRAIRIQRLRSHPQYTSENSVDFAHLGFLHGYTDMKQLHPAKIEGPFLIADYSFTKRMLPHLIRFVNINVEVEVNVWGLGVSSVRISGVNIDFEARQWILATPIDGEEIDVWVGMEMKRMPIAFGIKTMNFRLFRRLAAELLAREVAAEVRLDAVIWGRQKFQPEPTLCQADRDILRYRHYCEQFYPETAQEELRVVASEASG